jgi:hypothetical protein
VLVKHQTPVGFIISVDGVPRTFHDRREVAYGMARYLKENNTPSIITILDEATGHSVTMLEDGRTA